MINELIEKYHEDCVALTQELVRIPTVHGVDTEWPLIRYIAQKAFELDLPTIKIEAISDRPNLFVGRSFDKKTGIALVSHADTVSIGEKQCRTVDPLGGHQQGDKLFGRGVMDCKSGIALSLYALKILYELGYPEAAKMVVWVDEESGWNSPYGLKKVLDEWFQAKGALYLFGGNGKHDVLNIGHRGLLRIAISCRGEATHTAWADWEFKRKGENAVEALIELIYRLQHEWPFHHYTHRYFPWYRTMFTPVYIAWGENSSIIPGYAKVIIDIRTLPSVANSEVVRFVDFFLKQLSTQKKIFEFAVLADVPPVVIDIDDPFVEHVVDYMKTTYRVEHVLFKGAWPTNETHLFEKNNIPMLTGIGPMGDNSHGVDEWVNIPSMKQCLHDLVSIALAYME